MFMRKTNIVRKKTISSSTPCKYISLDCMECNAPIKNSAMEDAITAVFHLFFLIVPRERLNIGLAV